MNNNDSLANTAVRALDIARCSGGMGNCGQQHEVNSRIHRQEYTELTKSKHTTFTSKT